MVFYFWLQFGWVNRFSQLQGKKFKVHPHFYNVKEFNDTINQTNELVTEWPAHKEWMDFKRI
jgi:hypothetical protein